jgi:hypothetical protein
MSIKDHIDFLSNPATQLSRRATTKSMYFKKLVAKGRSVSNAEIAESIEKIDYVFIRIIFPDDSTVLKFPLSITMEDIFNYCIKIDRNLDQGEYTLEQTNGGVIEMDRTLDFYFQKNKSAEFRLVKGPPQYRTMSVMDQGQEVMILKNKNGEFQVTAGTLEKLIQRATDSSEKDMIFVDSLLLTYRQFVSPTEFFDELDARFNSELPLEASPAEIEYFNSNKLDTQIRYGLVKLM